MSPEITIPTPDPIPVDWTWLQILSTLTFAVHLLLVSAVIGTAVISLFNRLRPATSLRDELARDLSGRLPYVIAFAINMGVPPLLFFSALWGHAGYVSAVLTAVWWVSIVPVLIAAYYGAYAWKRFPTSRAGAVLLGGIVPALLFVAFVFVNNMTLAQRPEAWSGYLADPGGTLLNLGDPTLPPRYLHFLTASVAIGGLFIALVWRRREKKGRPGAAEKIKAGLRFFVGATVVQLGVGVWFLLAQPARVRDVFLGGDLTATGLLAAAVLGALLSLVLALKKRPTATASVVLVVVSLMVICRELLRRATLGPTVLPETAEVTGEYGPMILFLVALVVGAAAVIYLVRLAGRARADEEAS